MKARVYNAFVSSKASSLSSHQQYTLAKSFLSVSNFTRHIGHLSILWVQDEQHTRWPHLVKTISASFSKQILQIGFPCGGVVSVVDDAFAFPSSHAFITYITFSKIQNIASWTIPISWFKVYNRRWCIYFGAGWRICFWTKTSAFSALISASKHFFVTLWTFPIREEHS